MSTDLRPPLRPLSSRAPQTPRTPRTPHAIRAIQQRSGAGQRSARIEKLRNTGGSRRPESARAILRRLAQITAGQPKRRVSTPKVADKENETPRGLDDAEDWLDEDEEEGTRPELSLPVLDEDVTESDVGEPPEVSLLPDDYGPDPTITFQNLRSQQRLREPMSDGPSRRVSRVSNARTNDDDEEGERTMEIGRRAASEGPMDRYPRSSFGSIRMSDFGREELRRVSGSARIETPKSGQMEDYDGGFLAGDDDEVEAG